MYGCENEAREKGTEWVRARARGDDQERRKSKIGTEEYTDRNVVGNGDGIGEAVNRRRKEGNATKGGQGRKKGDGISGRRD